MHEPVKKDKWEKGEDGTLSMSTEHGVWVVSKEPDPYSSKKWVLRRGTDETRFRYQKDAKEAALYYLEGDRERAREEMQEMQAAFVSEVFHIRLSRKQVGVMQAIHNGVDVRTISQASRSVTFLMERKYLRRVSGSVRLTEVGEKLIEIFDVLGYHPDPIRRRG